MKNEDNTPVSVYLFAAVVSSPLVLGLVALTTLINGLCISAVWNWHVVPVFGATPMTWQQAAGVFILYQLIKGFKNTEPDVRTKDQKWIDGIIQILAPAGLLLIAWWLS